MKNKFVIALVCTLVGCGGGGSGSGGTKSSAAMSKSSAANTTSSAAVSSEESSSTATSMPSSESSSAESSSVESSSSESSSVSSVLQVSLAKINSLAAGQLYASPLRDETTFGQLSIDNRAEQVIDGVVVTPRAYSFKHTQSYEVEGEAPLAQWELVANIDSATQNLIGFSKQFPLEDPVVNVECQSLSPTHLPEMVSPGDEGVLPGFSCNKGTDLPAGSWKAEALGADKIQLSLMQKTLNADMTAVDQTWVYQLDAAGNIASASIDGLVSFDGDIAPARIAECSSGSIDRYQHWLASGEGPTIPASGSLLITDGDYKTARAEFTQNAEWHVLVVWLGNSFGASLNLSGSKGFWLSYSATSDFYIQLRNAANWSGGSKWHMPIPNTNGEKVTRFFPFDATQWIERLGTPPLNFADTLKDSSGFVVVGNTANKLNFYRLVIDGYTPTCK